MQFEAFHPWISIYLVLLYVLEKELQVQKISNPVVKSFE